jgi:hypothetical protein
MNGTNVLYARSLPLSKMWYVIKKSLIEAMEARRDGVFFRIVHSVSDIGNLRIYDTSMLYHRSCYKTYTSRRNSGFFKVESAGSDHKTRHIAGSLVERTNRWHVYRHCTVHILWKTYFLKRQKTPQNQNSRTPSKCERRNRRTECHACHSRR